MVRAQETLLEHLGVQKTFMCNWRFNGRYAVITVCATFPDKTFPAIPIACSSSHSAQNIMNELARQAIMADPIWDNGKYVLKKVHQKMV